MFESSPKAFWVCRKLKVEMFWLRKLGESFLLRRLRRTGWPGCLTQKDAATPDPSHTTSSNLILFVLWKILVG